ncbi:N-acetyltransferase [Sphingomonas metalli]|uniref:N-acetyltransferase n=1 Tax=Sphingomonas metalli TaxID=1779358 RepID=A0A916T838_9SPHN|nr:GNAT family N-acetyltransferase [Sphingomonas metalli]GGB32791.1 N-acetyltransferase [Sphingomonas metalli]
MPDWRLRQASVDDAAAVALVAQACFLATFAGVLAGPDILAHLAGKSSADVFARWAADDAAVLTLAEHIRGGAPVGYTLLTPPDEVGETRPGDIELRRIYALSTMHGTGLGAALLAQAVADARNRGARRMLLGVFAGNLRARRFYEREGFVAIAERRFKVGATLHDDFVYALEL